MQALDAGAVDGGDSVVLTPAPGDLNILLANEISGSVVVGPPALAAGLLYIPLGVTPPTDSGTAPMTMVVLRLAYTPSN